MVARVTYLYIQLLKCKTEDLMMCNGVCRALQQLVYLWSIGNHLSLIPRLCGKPGNEATKTLTVLSLFLPQGRKWDFNFLTYSVCN